MQSIKISSREIEALYLLVRQLSFKFLPSESDELAQRVILRFLAKPFVPPNRAYVFVLVRNAARDLIRQLQRERNHFPAEYVVNIDGTVSIYSEDEEDQYPINLSKHSFLREGEMTDDVKAEINHAVGMLPDGQREVLIMEANGYSYAEMAQSAQVSIGTVRSRLYHARKKARNMLSHLVAEL